MSFDPFEPLDKSIGTDLDYMPTDPFPREGLSQMFTYAPTYGLRQSHIAPEPNPNFMVNSRSLMTPKLPQVRRFKSQHGISDRSRLLSMQRVRRKLVSRSQVSAVEQQIGLLHISTLKQEAPLRPTKLVHFLQSHRVTPQSIKRKPKPNDSTQLKNLCIVPSRPKRLVIETP